MADFFAASAQAVLQVLLLCAGGYYLEWSGALGPAKRAGIVAVCYQLLLPCMNAANITAALGGSGGGSLGVICLYSFLMHVCGAAMGAAAAPIVVHKGDEFSRTHVILACCFGNNSGLPLVVFPAVALQGALMLLPGGESISSSLQLGIGTIALYNIVSALLLWTFGPRLLRRAAADLGKLKGALDVDKPREIPAMMQAALRWLPPSWHSACLGCMDAVMGILTPPTVGALCGLFVGSIPALRAIVLNRQPVVPPGAGTNALDAVSWTYGLVSLPAFNASVGGGGAPTPFPALSLLHNASGWYAGTAASSLLAGLGVTADTAGISDVAAAAAMAGGTTINVAPLGPSLFGAVATFASAAPSLMAVNIGSSIAARPPQAKGGTAAHTSLQLPSPRRFPFNFWLHGEIRLAAARSSATGSGSADSDPSVAPPCAVGDASSSSASPVSDAAAAPTFSVSPSDTTRERLATERTPREAATAAPSSGGQPLSPAAAGAPAPHNHQEVQHAALSADAPYDHRGCETAAAVGAAGDLHIVSSPRNGRGDGDSPLSGDMASGARASLGAGAGRRGDSAPSLINGTSHGSIADSHETPDAGKQLQQLDPAGPLPYAWWAQLLLRRAPACSSGSSSGGGGAVLKAGEVRWQSLAAIIVCRLLLLPVCGLATVSAMLRAGVLPKEQSTIVFVLLLESAVPPAMNLQLCCDLAGVGGKQMGKMILWTYLACVVSLTLWISVFLYAMAEGLLNQ